MNTNELKKLEEINLNTIRENIIFQLINTEQNYDKLREIPHREFEDLSIIYKWIIKMDTDNIQSIVIDNELSERLGLNEGQLCKYAVENTRRLLPPIIMSINDIVKNICPMITNEMPEETIMWIISNPLLINGAASILYEDVLYELSVKLGDDLYILPSSVHECIAVRSSLGDPYQFSQMVTEINITQVSLEKRLSNQVYRYSRDTRKLTLATNNHETHN